MVRFLKGSKFMVPLTLQIFLFVLTLKTKFPLVRSAYGVDLTHHLVAPQLDYDLLNFEGLPPPQVPPKDNKDYDDDPEWSNENDGTSIASTSSSPTMQSSPPGLLLKEKPYGDLEKRFPSRRPLGARVPPEAPAKTGRPLPLPPVGQHNRRRSSADRRRVSLPRNGGNGYRRFSPPKTHIKARIASANQRKHTAKMAAQRLENNLPPFGDNNEFQYQEMDFTSSTRIAKLEIKVPYPLIAETVDPTVLTSLSKSKNIVGKGKDRLSRNLRLIKRASNAPHLNVWIQGTPACHYDPNAPEHTHRTLPGTVIAVFDNIKPDPSGESVTRIDLMDKSYKSKKDLQNFNVYILLRCPVTTDPEYCSIKKEANRRNCEMKLLAFDDDRKPPRFHYLPRSTRLTRVMVEDKIFRDRPFIFDKTHELSPYFIHPFWAIPYPFLLENNKMSLEGPQNLLAHLQAHDGSMLGYEFQGHTTGDPRYYRFPTLMAYFIVSSILLNDPRFYKAVNPEVDAMDPERYRDDSIPALQDHEFEQNFGVVVQILKTNGQIPESEKYTDLRGSRLPTQDFRILYAGLWFKSEGDKGSTSTDNSPNFRLTLAATAPFNIIVYANPDDPRLGVGHDPMKMVTKFSGIWGQREDGSLTYLTNMLGHYLVLFRSNMYSRHGGPLIKEDVVEIGRFTEYGPEYGRDLEPWGPGITPTNVPYIQLSALEYINPDLGQRQRVFWSLSDWISNHYYNPSTNNGWVSSVLSKEWELIYLRDLIAVGLWEQVLGTKHMTAADMFSQRLINLSFYFNGRTDELLLPPQTQYVGTIQRGRKYWDPLGLGVKRVIQSKEMFRRFLVELIENQP